MTSFPKQPKQVPSPQLCVKIPEAHPCRPPRWDSRSFIYELPAGIRLHLTVTLFAFLQLQQRSGLSTNHPVLLVLLWNVRLFFSFVSLLLSGFTLQSRLALNLTRFPSAPTGQAGQVNATLLATLWFEVQCLLMLVYRCLCSSLSFVTNCASLLVWSLTDPGESCSCFNLAG